MICQLYPNNEFLVVVGKKRASRQKKAPRPISELKGMDKKRLPDSRILDLLPQLSQDIKGAPRKRAGMSVKARNKILHLSSMMDERNKDRQVFATGTLPGGTDLAMKEFTRLSGYCVKMVQTYMPRALGCESGDLSVVWCWELQKRGALHMHLAIETSSVSLADELCEAWRDIWSNVLVLVNRKATTDIFKRRRGGTWAGLKDVWQVDCEKVKKGVSKYLSKYLGKEKKGMERYYPARWYGASRKIRQSLKAWMMVNTRWYDVEIDGSADFDEVKGDILGILSSLGVRGSKDRSQWYQSLTVSAYTYVSQPGEIWGDVEDMIDALKGKLVRGADVMKGGNEVTIESIMSDVFFAMKKGMPYWAYIELERLFCDALSYKLDARSIGTKVGWLHLRRSMDWICRKNSTGAVDEGGWPERMKKAMRSAERKMVSANLSLPLSLKSVEEGEG